MMEYFNTIMELAEARFKENQIDFPEKRCQEIKEIFELYHKSKQIRLVPE